MPEFDLAKAQLLVYTDGSGTIGGAAGIGYVVEADGEHYSEGSLSLANATSQQAEILAAAYALHSLPEGLIVEIVSDSEYVVRGWNEYPKRKRKQNLAHWIRLTEAVARHRGVMFRWTKGHAGTPGNVRADQLAGAARRAALEAS